MHAAVYRSRMTEETFQVLLDVMERHFAALSLPDPVTDPKITRAISFSELPTSRRILIEQCYQHDDSGNLIRQYSCEQIFDKSSNTREVKVSEIVRTGSERCLTNTWKTTFPVFGSLGNAGWHTGQFGQTIKAIEPKAGARMESMEIEEIALKNPFDEKHFKKPFRKNNSEELPTLALNGMTISGFAERRGNKPLVRASTFGSYRNHTPMEASVNIKKEPFAKSRSVSPTKFTDHPPTADFKITEFSNSRETINRKADYNSTKKKLRYLVSEEKPVPMNSRYSCSCYKFIFFLLLSFAAAILAAFIYDEDLSRNQRGFDFTNMSLEFSERVYGQDRAIGELIKDLRRSSSGVNFIALVGGTGVGKSYTVGIVKKHFPHVYHIFEYFPPLHKTVHDAYGALSRRHCNLIILENLTSDDLRDALIFVKFMRKQKDEFCVYTVAVINPQERDDDFARKLDLKRSVEEITEVLKKNYFEDSKVIGFEELDERSLDACILRAAKENHVKITEGQLTDIRKHLVTANSGCKGAYAKVQLLVHS